LSNVKGRCVVITGRGGTGKSTFVALMTRFLGELGYKPLLVVDSDPDESLAEMLGVDLLGEGKETVSEMIFDIIVGE